MAQAQKKLWFSGIKQVAAVAAVGVFVVAGIQVTQHSKAASTNPYGGVDYCALSGTTTIIYGWATDANATSLAQPSVSVSVNNNAQVFPTSFAGYRDGPINDYINQSHAGDPKPGTYGFQARFSNLYKGTVNNLSVIALNVGAGANVALYLNTSGSSDGQPRPTFAGGRIPDACLAARPVAPPPPPPAPAPAPTPTPTPPPAHRPSGSVNPVQPAPAPAGPGVSSDANAAVTPGTLSAQMIVPAGNATSVHIAYGASPVLLDESTEDAETSGGDTFHLLTGLKDNTTYTYQIVRSDSTGRTATSPPASFTTKGYDLAVFFTSAQAKDISGITAQIASLKKSATSGKDGKVVFKNISSGDYTLDFSFKGKRYKQSIKADSSSVGAGAADSAQTVTLSHLINVDKLSTGAVQPKSASKLPIFLIIAAALATVAIYAVVRRRRGSSDDEYYESMDFPVVAMEESTADEQPGDEQIGETTAAPPIIVSPGQQNSPAISPPADVAAHAPKHRPAHAAHDAQPPETEPGAEHMGQSIKSMVLHGDKPAPAVRHTDSPHARHAAPLPEDEPEAEHMGESLKTMVLRSMREEAQRRQSGDESPKEPKTPWQK